MTQSGKNFTLHHFPRSKSSTGFIKKLLSSKVFLFFIVLTLISLATSVGRESYHKYQLTKEINRLKSETERLAGKNQQLANLLEHFKEESYLEKEARLKLNLKKPGEKVVILPQSDSPEDLPLEAQLEIEKEEEKEEEINWWKWWEYFFLRD